MFIRAYLRASTEEQDATRAKKTLGKFAADRGHRIAAYYIENISGNVLNRPELSRLLNDSEPGDILLVESIDRLTRLNRNDWDLLKQAINNRGIHVTSLDLETSHMALGSFPSEDFMNSILSAVNTMLLDILAASSYKEYGERERKQREGIQKAREQGKYRGKKPDQAMHDRILKLTSNGLSINDIAQALDVSRSTVIRVRKLQNVMTDTTGEL